MRPIQGTSTYHYLIIMVLFGCQFQCAVQAETEQDLIQRQKAQADQLIKEGYLKRLADDPHRPRYHYLPTEGDRLRDNFCIYWKGWYHIFYLYGPTRVWSDWLHWGHARSRDLVNWEELPIALTSGPEEYDQGMVMAGCIFADESGKVHIFYTAQPSAGQCHAVALDDSLISWEKNPDNPVAPILDHPPKGLRNFCLDPDIWKEGETWYMLLASSFNGTGAAPILTSPDLKNWTYSNIFFQDDRYVYFEVPFFFRLDGRDVLFVHGGRAGTDWISREWEGKPFEGRYTDRNQPGSVLTWTGHYRVGAYVGRVVDRVFHPDRSLEFDSALNMGGKTLLDHKNRRIIIGWVLEDRYGGPAESQPKLKSLQWVGFTSLPRVLHVREDNWLTREPVEELKTLRDDHRVVPAMDIGQSGNEEIRPLDGIQGDALEIIARFTPRGADHFGLTVRMSPDQSEITRIEVDRVRGKLVIDNTQGTLNADPDMHRHRVELEFPGAKDDQIELRVFLDRSVIEVFGNRNEVALTGRTYPTRADSQQVAVWTAGGQVHCDAIDVWKMKDITIIKR